MFFKLRALKDFANFRGNTCVGASLLEKQNAFQLPLFFFYLFSTLPDNEEFKTQIYFTDLRTAHTVRLFVTIKRNFSGLLFF